jgi:hypothetical protein
MINMRGFTVHYVPWTDRGPARVKIYDNRFHKAVYASYHDNPSDRVEEIAQNYLKQIGIVVTHMAQAKKGFMLLTPDFETELR